MQTKFVPCNVLKLWFWMIDDSGSVELEQSATESILRFYRDINVARKDYEMSVYL